MATYAITLTPGLRAELEKENWEIYEVKKGFHLGEIDEKIGRGETVQVSDKYVLFRDEYLFRRRIFNKFLDPSRAWITPLFPSSDEVVETQAPKMPKGAAEAVAKSRLAASLLPQGWDELHWTKKVKKIEEIERVDMLQNILQAEKAPAVTKAVKKKMEQLGVAAL